ncbi:hypothetical protein M011DRAFT_464981 [Sporormia fimetaria CBS 119925]|uniref:DUF3533 domain-containing protein n=1 Tax=Sporormia fimetaria CBS 119925 TaxID=1340428 RepID=A0A6A6VKF6_9PLEO|nr:hypothetical protein M011DRAFT_464981 [Sporormia fimetaria CBS 119925]
MVKVSFSSFRDLHRKQTLDSRNRTSFFSNDFRPSRNFFIKKTSFGSLLYMIWFLLSGTYLYGSLYRAPERYHNLRVLAVDYDGGVIGESLKVAYRQLEGPSFFHLDFQSPEEYPTEEDMYHAVWEGRFWGAISATRGASDRLSTALQNSNAASSYRPQDALHYVWNQQYYPAYAASVIQAGMEKLIIETQNAYAQLNGTSAFQLTDSSSRACILALLHPISGTSRDVKYAGNGTSVLLNTIATIIPVLSQFFFLLVLNGVTVVTKLYPHCTPNSSYLIRRLFGLLYAFGSALAQTGYTWYYSEAWSVNGAQFMLTWMTFWLLMLAHQVFLETFSSLADVRAMPFVVLLWLFMNISSTLSPLEIQPAFFKWSICLPGHNAHSLLVTIFTGGADNEVYRALPILFAWLVAGLLTTYAAHLKVCHDAFMNVRSEELKPRFGKDEEEGREKEDVPMSQETTMSRSEVDLTRRARREAEEENEELRRFTREEANVSDV